MGTVTGGPNVITNGLVLNLDAANTKSYPGSGTTWADLSRGGNNGTLVNGPTFNSANGGSIVFDGVNETINLGTGNTFFPIPQFTIQVWFKSLGTVPTTGTSPSIYGFTYGIRCIVGSTNLLFSVDNGTNLNATSTTGTIPFMNGNWYSCTMTHDGTVNKMYVNGTFNTSVNRTWSGTSRWPTDGWNLGRDNNNNNQFFFGHIGQCKIYNRVLSDTEILQNFNSSRARFGI
jgi:hypothetical protein